VLPFFQWEKIFPGDVFEAVSGDIMKPVQEIVLIDTSISIP